MPKAAVMVAPGAPLEVHDIEVPAPRAGEARVRMAASGICHSDLNMWHAAGMAEPPPWHPPGQGVPLPMVLGHEGSGVVVEVGPGVTEVVIGDHVVLSPIPQCGECFYCRHGQAVLCERSENRFRYGDLGGEPRLRVDGRPLHQFCFLGTFAEEIVAPAISMVAVDRRVPLPGAALVGCAITTGVGAATRTAQVGPGDVVVVVGCGGVGLNVVQGARLAGASHIVAVDIEPGKLDIARTLGATSTVDGRHENPAITVRALTQGRGADAGFAAVGVIDAIKQMISMVRPGGQCILLGLPYGPDPTIDVRTIMANSAKALQGCLYGSTSIREDFPRQCELYLAGDLLIDELISERIGLDGVDTALRKLDAGGPAARSVIVYGDESDSR